MRCSLSSNKNVNLEIYLESVASTLFKCFLMKGSIFPSSNTLSFHEQNQIFLNVLWMEKWKLQSHNLPVLLRETLSALKMSMVKKELIEKEKLGDRLSSQQALYFLHIRYSWRKKYCPSHSKHLSQSSLRGIGTLLGYKLLAVHCHPDCLFVCSPKSWPLVVPTQLAKS